MKYLINGQAVEVIQKLDNGEILVRPILYAESEMSNFFSPEVMTVKQVYDNAPALVYDKEIERLKESRRALRLEIKDLTNEVTSGRAEVIKQRKKFAQCEQLKQLENFIEGRITHYVILENWDGPKMEKAEGREKRLVSLFGGSDGNLAWKINQYGDGSGGYTEIIPVASEEEGIAEIQKWILERMDSKKPQESHLRWADKWGIEVPKEYRIAVLNNRLAAQEANIEKQMCLVNSNAEEARKIKAELKGLEGERPVMWFGKGCELQSCKWEGSEETECEPVLVFCNHEKNPNDREGNCRPDLCPLEVE